MKMRNLSALCVVFALTVGGTSAIADKGGNSGKGGNSANAKRCQKGGWQNWRRENQTPFTNQGQCVSYGAKGGTLTAPTIASTISTYVFRTTPGLSAVYAIRGSGFTPNHAITVTVTGFGAFGGLIGANPLTQPTNANGAFDSGTVALWTGVYLACREIPETAHVTASDGTHQASTDINFTTCP
jgi:hypothetical protein